MVHMAERVAESSDGAMRIDIYPGEQLGTERQALELLQIGSVGMTKVSSAVLEGFAPEFRVLSLPFLFRDEAHRFAVLDGPIGRELLEGAARYRLRGLVFYDAGARSFYTVDRPIRQPADLEGLKIRTQESPVAGQMVSTLGGSATPIAWGELYTALQQGVVDGAENNPPSFHLSRHYEVCRYYTLDEHTAVPDVLLVSTHVWSRLTERERAWLTEAAAESAELQKRLWREATDAALAAVREAGVTVIEPDRAAFRRRAAPLLDRYRHDPGIAPFLRRIEAVR
jgi:tripartite ATP-independent transporter DctP family solute receptor